MIEESFDIVDGSDTVIGQAPRSVVHANRWLHRASHIFVFNSRGELLIHRRSATKDECPNLCTSSASGHVSAGEDYGTAATRELQEELGLTTPVEFLGIIPANGEKTSFEHSGLFRTTTDEAPRFDPAEIASGEFLSLQEIDMRLENDSADFTPCFRILFRWYQDTCGK
ncbi:MAG: NUDIX domain-containing protein [Planctomycetales bacterium]|jgi:16S rRNA (adenine1518-N6/adenine1519-N6)-dimethyltransferase|nr:NUDIX domain-containing protein [Planctomycetales bacterium]